MLSPRVCCSPCCAQAGLPQLRSLSLSRVPAATDRALIEGVCASAHCRGLRKLRLDYCQGVSDAALRCMAAGCAQLQDLSLVGCHGLASVFVFVLIF